MNKVQGAIKAISEPQQITEKFSKVEMVIETTDDLYPQTLLIEWPNDSASKVAAFGEGDIVEIDINIRGREWTSPKGDVRHFISLTGWRISAVTGGGASAPAPSAAPAPPATEEEDDDLPF